MKYARRLEIVDAVQWQLGDEHPNISFIPGATVAQLVNTSVIVFPGDYLVTDVFGQVTAMRKERFEACYSPAEDALKSAIPKKGKARS